MEKDPPRSLRMQIHFASLRLLLDRVASKLLVRLAWCLQLHILNFTTLTVMADKPIYFLPMIAYQLRWVLKSDWLSETNRKNSKEFQEAISDTVDKMKMFGLWIAITLIFHRHSSPLATMRLNRVISKAYENEKVFWAHVFIFKLLPLTDGSALLLRMFFSVLRFFHGASRMVCPIVNFCFFEFLDWIWPKRYAIGRCLGWIVFKIFERHIEGFLFMYVVNRISMLVRGDPLFGHQYWSGPASLHISIVTTAEYLLVRTRSSRKPWARSRPNVTTPAPLESFKYSPIEEKDTIRLLLIYPRHPDGSVKCALFQTPLSSVPRYEAISYRWGGSGPNAEISVNDRSVMVTPNAWEVLKNRSSFWQPKLVWIDSVCIDQTNEDEKARQIELMEEIYRKAYIVSAALVVNLEALDIKEELRKLMGNWAVEIWSGWARDPNIAEFQNAAIKHLMVSLAADVLDDFRLSYFQTKSNRLSWYRKFASQRYTWRIKAFRQFLANSWFDRMWVVQEVALPPSLRVIYGDLEIDWTLLVDAISLISENSVLSGPLLESGDSVGFRRSPPAACGTILLMTHIRQLVQDDQDRPLGELLLRCRQFAATEPKDKLFAIRGICSKLPEALLKPTESIGKTWEEVFFNAAECLVSEGDAARMLAACGCIAEGDARSTVTLPSWVPDWSIRQAGSLLSFSDEKMDYKAGGPEPVKARIEMQSLFLDGILFDRIVDLGPIWDVFPFFAGPRQTSECLFDSSELLKASYEKVIRSTWTKEQYPGFEDQRLREAFWRTLIGNRTSKENPAPSNLAKAFEMYEKCMADIIRNPDRIRNNAEIGLKEQEELISMSYFSHPLMRCWAGRRVCITMKGYIGIVPPRSEIGDKIVVFIGMQTPSVLRMGNGNGGMKHQNIGECYVHGLMNGEIFDTGTPRREFELI